MRHDWPFAGRPAINGAFFAVAIAGALLIVWIVVLMAVINAQT